MYKRLTIKQLAISVATAVIVLLALALRPTSAFGVELIANSAVPVDQISIRELRAIYTMKRKRWHDSMPIAVFVLKASNSTHAGFCKEILRLFPHQLQTGWDRLVYSGRGAAPTEVANEEEMLNLIATTPGAIGYVSELKQGQGVKKLVIDK